MFCSFGFSVRLVLALSARRVCASAFAFACASLRRVALIWSNFYFIYIQCLVLFRFSACALFKQFLFCSEMGKINRYIINNCFAFVDFVHISIAFVEKLVLLFLLFASRFVLLILFMFVFFSFRRSGSADLWINAVCVFYQKKFYVNLYAFVQNMNCKLKIKNQKTIKKLKIENRKCKSGSEKQKLIFWKLK